MIGLNDRGKPSSVDQVPNLLRGGPRQGQVEAKTGRALINWCGAGNIGRATRLLFGRRWAPKVTSVADIRTRGVASTQVKTIKEAGGPALPRFHAADVSNPQECRRADAQRVETYGKAFDLRIQKPATRPSVGTPDANFAELEKSGGDRDQPDGRAHIDLTRPMGSGFATLFVRPKEGKKEEFRKSCACLNAPTWKSDIHASDSKRGRSNREIERRDELAKLRRFCAHDVSLWVRMRRPKRRAHAGFRSNSRNVRKNRKE